MIMRVYEHRAVTYVENIISIVKIVEGKWNKTSQHESTINDTRKFWIF